MSKLAELNLKGWIEEHRHLLKPPVGNAQIWENADFIVMIVGGPNARKDYHINPTEELFHQIEGDITLKIIEDVIADAELHDTGIRALCNWPNASIAPRLIELAESDPHADHRLRSLRALIRVAPLPDERTNAERLAVLKKAMTMCERDKERLYVLDRAKAVRIPESLRFVMSHVEQPRFAEQVCLTVVELAHHRGLREPNKAEFHRALDKVIATSKDAEVVDRAQRYKKDQTWVRPKAKK